jgi:hypothetical protein
MGTLTALTIGGYDFYSTRSYADPLVMTIFTEDDRFEKSSVTSDDSLDYAEDQYDRTEIGYTAPAAVIRDRLDVMGFTLRAAKETFEQGVRTRLAELREWENEPDEFANHEIATLEALSFEVWLQAFREIVSRGLYWWHVDPALEDKRVPDVSTTAAYMLENDADHFWGFPRDDVRYVLRAAIGACDLDTPIVQDLTGVISAGYHGRDQRLAAEARERLLNDFPANARIIVLTEGVTDRRALEGALRLLYPHLAEYYSFMDFSEAQLSGGAGAVVTTLKAFAGAGIVNRTVALLDNDTAAQAAVRPLHRVKLPPNMRVLHYPVLEFARQYPTVGPNGEAAMDVNGLAGSLELYFGIDVLRRDDGELIPVHWRAFDNAVGQYQGELMEKPASQERFEKKLSAARRDATLLESLDWSGMRAILDHLRNAFI